MWSVLLTSVQLILTSVLAVDYLEVERPSNRPYSISAEICCNGTIYENKNSVNYECCGGKLIEKKTEICCFPEVYSRQPNVECCGNKSFNNLTHACHTAVHTRTKTYVFSVGQRLILPIGVNESSTCGDKVMNLDKEICCNFQIFADPKHKLHCCDDTMAYNPDTEICCYTYNQNTIISKANPKDTDCCGEMSYDSNTKFCSNGSIVDRPNDNFQTCNDTIFNMSEEICCWDFSPLNTMKKLEPDHDSCCGNFSYNRNKSICCVNWNDDGKVKHGLYSRVGAVDKVCCGSELIDMDHGCCHNQKPYDPKTQTCCSLLTPFSSKMYTKISEGVGGKCCGLDVMDAGKDECCGFSVIPKSIDGQSGCCVHTISNFIQVVISMDKGRFYSDNLRK